MLDRSKLRQVSSSDASTKAKYASSILTSACPVKTVFTTAVAANSIDITHARRERHNNPSAIVIMPAPITSDGSRFSSRRNLPSASIFRYSVQCVPKLARNIQ